MQNQLQSLFWRFEASLAIVVFLSILAGILIASIIASSIYIRRHVKKQDRHLE
jgi:uncharacterized integral membrane protein